MNKTKEENNKRIIKYNEILYAIASAYCEAKVFVTSENTRIKKVNTPAPIATPLSP